MSSYESDSETKDETSRFEGSRLHVNIVGGTYLAIGHQRP